MHRFQSLQPSSTVRIMNPLPQTRKRSLEKVKWHSHGHTASGAQRGPRCAWLLVLGPLTLPLTLLWALGIHSLFFYVLSSPFPSPVFKIRVLGFFSFLKNCNFWESKLDHIIILEVQRWVLFSLQLCFELITIFGDFFADLSLPWHRSTDEEDVVVLGDKGRDSCTPFLESIYRHLWLTAYLSAVLALVAVVLNILPGPLGLKSLQTRSCQCMQGWGKAKHIHFYESQSCQRLYIFKRKLQNCKQWSLLKSLCGIQSLTRLWNS